MNEQLRDRVIEATGVDQRLIFDWIRGGEITYENAYDCAARLVLSMSHVYTAEGRRFTITVDQVAEYFRDAIAEVSR